MSIISSYSNQFKSASKKLTKAETKEFLQKRQYEEAQKETVNCTNTYFTKGLLYYDNDKRVTLLKSAEKLCYSKVAIEHLKSFNCENWNSDNVTLDDIRELESIEEFVQNNTPLWEKSMFTQLGKFVNQTE